MLKPKESPVNGATSLTRLATPGVNAWAREKQSIFFTLALRWRDYP